MTRLQKNNCVEFASHSLSKFETIVVSLIIAYDLI